MASQNPSAPPRAVYGVQHVNTRHTRNFTVISNDLIRHPHLSANARMLGAYIQSLRPGAPVGIKALAKQVPLGEKAISRALRDLEAHGYLKRVVEQLPNGQFVTRTVSYNQPKPVTPTITPTPGRTPKPYPTPEPHPAPEPCRAPDRAPEPAPEPCPAPDRAPEAAREPYPGPDRAPGPAPDLDPNQGSASVPEAGREPESAPEPELGPPPASEPGPHPESGPGTSPSPTAAAASASVPVPRNRDNPARRALATEILSELRLADPRLLLGERDVQRLVGGVEAWLERGAAHQAVTGALCGNLPEPLRNPSGLLAHRLSAQLPPALAAPHRRPAFVPPDPLQNCPKCDRAFRSPTPGTCTGCTTRPGDASARPAGPHRGPGT
ncbi:helix-turn-helix domain-containing protein [Streptomyces sp. NBC_01565]|uniref:helix-turn-helix domain-containing protein n=1 Tax=Streptomyces sp. NBC_01565 TaxID=2975881 RepID=UPI00225905CB|nr:helix-turn-helix domain-containing protein [Streptomyces sp. NBC_01565]MCX4542744.1 helix-turn-helix domain-containing protein [Streptomyces sp. NBC_01565]